MITEHSTTAAWLLRDGWRNLLGVYAVVIVAEIANDYIDMERPALSIAAAGLMVTAISIFLVFRVGEAYARWWEARTLWGGIVNASRRFARQVTTLIKARDVHHELVHRQIAWVIALRLSLRRQDDWHELAPFVAEKEREQLRAVANPANQLLQTQARRLAEVRDADELAGIDMIMLDQSMASLTDMQGGCERIKNTAFPDHVAWISHKFAWGLAALIAIAVLDRSNDFDLVDFLVVPFIMQSFIVTERVGSELRNPFENEQNDTPMTALCRTIEIDLRQQLGETDVPRPLKPVDGVLM